AFTGAAALRAARERHHAVGAGFVAAFDDRDVRAVRIIAGGERSIEGFFGIERESGDAAVAGFELHQHLAEPRVAGRTGYQRDIRRPLENLFAFLLGHTAEHANDLSLAGIALEVLQPIEDFLLRLIPNAAPIKK